MKLTITPHLMNIIPKTALVLIMLTLSIFPSTAQDQKLLAHWSFDSSSGGTTFYDVTGNGFDATCTKQLTIQPGVKGGALESTVDGYTFPVANSSGNFNAPVFSIAALVYTNVAPNTYPGRDMHQIILSNQSYNTGAVSAGGYEIDISTSGTVSFKMAASGSGWVDCISNTVLAAKRWFHVVGTYDGDSMKIFVNGKPDKSIFQPADFIRPVQNANIGCQAGFPGGSARNWFNGRIDDLRLYNYALDAAAIAGLYSSYEFPQPPKPTPRLMAHWSFDSTDNSTVFFDNSGNGYTAKTAAITRAGGVRGKAFDCTNDVFEMRVPNSAPDFSVEQFTVEGWIYSYIDLVNPGSFYNYKGIFNYARCGMEGSGITGGYSLQISDRGRLFTSISSPSGGSWSAGESDEVLLPRTWYHVAVTYDKTALRLYLNGRQVKQAAAADSYLAPGNIPACIGAQFQVTDPATNVGRIRHRFSGKIDELKVYNYALDAQTLKAGYESLKPPVEPPFEINIGMKTTFAQPGDTVIMPVYIANYEDYTVSALQLTLRYNPSQLTLLSTSKDSGIVKNMELFSWNCIRPGSAPVAIAGTTVRLGYGEGELFRCLFIVASSAGNGDTCKVALDSAVIDEANSLVVSATQSGRIIISRQNIMYGDVTGNNEVSVVDAQQVLKYVVGALPLPDAVCCPDFTTAVADVSGNGSITSYDAALIFQYSLGLIPAFPVETASYSTLAKRGAAAEQNATLSISMNTEYHDAVVYDLVGSNMCGFYAGEFAIACDAADDLLSKSIITTDICGATLSSKYTAADHLLRVAVSSNDDVDHDSSIAIVRIMLPPAQQSAPNFTVKTALINEGAISTEFANSGLVGLLQQRTAQNRAAAALHMAGNQLTVNRASASSAAVVTVWNLHGRMVMRRVVSGSRAVIDIGKLGKGAYVVRLHNGASYETRRILLMDR